MATQAPTNAPTPYAAPYMNMEQQGQSQSQVPEREYTYTRGDVVYRGADARKMEMAQGLYDSGEYDYVDAVKLSEKLYNAQQMEKKLKVQDTFLAIGAHEARLKQQEVQNNKFANQQKVGAAIASINPSDLRNFQSNVQKLREQYSDAFATDPDLQSALAESIKRNENYGKMASEMAVSAGTSLNDSLLNDDGTFNMSRAYAAGRTQKERDLRLSEEVKLISKQREEGRKAALQALKEIEGRKEEIQSAQRAAAAGAETTVTQGGVTYKYGPSSALTGLSLKPAYEENIKKGKLPPELMQESASVNPNDRGAARSYAQEVAKLYKLSNNPDDRQLMMRFVRAAGYNVREEGQ